MKTCSVTYLTDWEVFDSFEWCSSVGVLIVCDVGFCFVFFSCSWPLFCCVFILVLRLLAHFYLSPYFSSVLPS